MEGEQSTPNRNSREDATTHPHQSVKFTFKANKPTETSANSATVPSVASDKSSSEGAKVAPLISDNKTSATTNDSEALAQAQDVVDVAMGEQNGQGSEKDEGANGTGSSERKEVNETANGKSTETGSSLEALGTSGNHLRTRTEELAQPPFDSINPGSPIVSSETPSRAPSPTPRESTPALSEAPSDTPSIDSSFAGPPPESSAFDLSHPLSAYQFANTTLVPVASTSTNPFHFVSWPPQPLEDSWQRTRLPDDHDANLVHDSEAGYLATPEEIAATKLRNEEKQAKIKARLAQAKGKGKAREAIAKPPPRARAMERAASGEGTAGTKRARPLKSTLQQQIQREPSPERSRPLVAKTRFARDLAMALLPDDTQNAMPLGILPHPDFIDLFALPPHYITEEGIPPKPSTSSRQRTLSAKAQQATPTPTATPTPNRTPVPVAAAAKTAGQPQSQVQSGAQSVAASPAAVAPAPAPQPATEAALDTNGTKRIREVTDEGNGGPKKKPKEESVEPQSPPAVGIEVAEPKPAVDYVTQQTTCLSKKIDGQMRCFQCVARSIGHGCCFLGIRSFGVDRGGTIVTPPIFLDTKAADDIPRFTKTHVSPLSDQYNQLMRTWLAPQLLPLVVQEREHAEDPATKRERLDLTVHSLCDTCNTSILGSEWMCSICGRVTCRTCHQALQQIGAQEAAGKKVDHTLVDIQRRRKCIAKKRGEKANPGEGHRSHQFVPMTRLDKKDLAQLYADVHKWKITHAIVPSNGAAKKFLDNTYLTESPLPDYDLNTHPVHHIPAADMNAAVFLELWNYSAPLLITDIDLAGLKRWTPSYISNRFPNLEIQLQNNKGSETLTAKVPYFFSQFNEDGGPQRSADVKQTFRTKEFPTARQFKREFKEMADEFYRVLPIRDVIHPDGPLNYLAHTPVNAIQPEIGPRGTNSWAVDAATGTTLLRTDATDIANLMYWGHHDEATGRELRIRWDVYKSEDVKGLRDYCWEVLTKKLPKGTSAAKFKETHDDPLLNPCVYLNQRQREVLAQTKKIYSHAIYQYPGQLVIIPAGCPYQVSSWSDHLSLTTQFLSGLRLGEAIKTNDACRRETKERTLWRVDNIQLERQLLYTWYSCQHADKKYVPTSSNWKPRSGKKTAEELAREAAEKNAAKAASKNSS
ncbi:hypothetical protein JCM3765_003248 [Sporobolomyces pararoseus]